MKEEPAPTAATEMARLAITEALHRYCVAVDSHDAAAFDALCAPDASVDFGARYQGSAAGFMVSLLEARARTLRMRHEVTDIAILLADDGCSASSTCAVQAAVLRIGENGEEWRRVRGLYEDRWTLVDGRWLLLHRRYRQLKLVGGHDQAPS
jgi:hypothetical protein